jgi:hypothetical protein
MEIRETTTEFDLRRCSGRFERTDGAIQGDIQLDSMGGPATLPVNETPLVRKAIRNEHPSPSDQVQAIRCRSNLARVRPKMTAVASRELPVRLVSRIIGSPLLLTPSNGILFQCPFKTSVAILLSYHRHIGKLTPMSPLALRKTVNHFIRFGKSNPVLSRWSK